MRATVKKKRLVLLTLRILVKKGGKASNYEDRTKEELYEQAQKSWY